MRVIATMLGLTMALALGAGQAHADDAGVSADVRCAIIGLSMATSNEQTVQAAGLMSSMYYVGRLDSHQPAIDMEARFIEEGQKMTSAEVTAEANACGERIQARLKTLMVMGQDMQKKAAASPAAAPAPQTPKP